MSRHFAFAKITQKNQLQAKNCLFSRSRTAKISKLRLHFDERRFSFWKRKNAVAALNDQKVLEKIPSDDKEILDFLNSYYYWYIVLGGLPVGFFLLMLYQIGKMYRENRTNGVLINIPLYTKFLKIWRNALILRKCRIYF